MGSEMSMMRMSKVWSEDLQERSRVHELDADARVLEGPGAHLGKMASAELHDLAVDVHHQHALHAPVFEDLANGRPLAATHHEDAPGMRMAQHGGMDDTLVVDEFVAVVDCTFPSRMSALP